MNYQGVEDIILKKAIHKFYSESKFIKGLQTAYIGNILKRGDSVSFHTKNGFARYMVCGEKVVVDFVLWVDRSTSVSDVDTKAGFISNKLEEHFSNLWEGKKMPVDACFALQLVDVQQVISTSGYRATFAWGISEQPIRTKKVKPIVKYRGNR